MQKSSLHIALLLFFVSITVINSSAQTPQQINYQAVARDASTGVEMINVPVEVVFKIINTNPSGPIVYQELHSTETNQFGLFNVQIGAGSSISGDFSAINWADQTKWLAVEIDLGDGFEEVSVTQLISVPYALHANTANTADNVDDADADPTNELIEEGSLLLIDTLLMITEGGITHQVSLASLEGDEDWEVTEAVIYNLNHKVGVGLDMPAHRFHLTNPGVTDADSVGIFSRSENGSVNTYGVFAQATGSPLQNRAIYGDSPGNTGTHWAGYFNRGNVFIDNRLAMGVGVPNAQLHLRGSADNLSIPLVLAEKEDETTALRVQSDGSTAIGEALPTSLFHVHGSVAAAVRYVTVSDGVAFSLDETDFMFIAAIDAGNIVVNLPPASSCPGRIYFIKRTFSNPTNNTLQIAPAAGETIDGTTFPVLLSSASNREKRILVSAGNNGWFVMSE